MPLNSPPPDDAGEWLRYAERDLDSAMVLLSAEPPRAEAALYHCQQAAEKALKSFLARHGTAVRKIHDLVPLGESCLEIDPTLETSVLPVYVLTRYASRFRYPGEPYEAGAEEARAAWDRAQTLCSAIRSRLARPAEPKPESRD